MKKEIAQEAQKLESKKSSSSLLERYIQRNIADQMQGIDDEILAKAIKTLLSQEQKNKHLH